VGNIPRTLQTFHHPPSPHTILESASTPSVPMCQTGWERHQHGDQQPKGTRRQMYFSPAKRRRVEHRGCKPFISSVPTLPPPGTPEPFPPPQRCAGASPCSGTTAGRFLAQGSFLGETGGFVACDTLQQSHGLSRSSAQLGGRSHMEENPALLTCGRYW